MSKTFPCPTCGGPARERFGVVSEAFCDPCQLWFELPPAPVEKCACQPMRWALATLWWDNALSRTVFNRVEGRLYVGDQPEPLKFCPWCGLPVPDEEVSDA